MTAHATRILPFVATGFALLASVGPLGASASSDQPFERIVARLDTIAPPYRAFRRLEAGIDGSSKAGWLEAWTRGGW